MLTFLSWCFDSILTTTSCAYLNNVEHVVEIFFVKFIDVKIPPCGDDFETTLRTSAFQSFFLFVDRFGRRCGT